MQYGKLMKTESGVILSIVDKAFPVHEVSPYKAGTSKWLNLVSKTESGEKVLELSDGEVRWYDQVLDMPDASLDMGIVEYKGRRFKAIETKVHAEVTTRTTGGITKEESITSLYADEEDEDVLFSIEQKGDKLFVWYSDRTISPRDIKLAQ